MKVKITLFFLCLFALSTSYAQRTITAKSDDGEEVNITIDVDDPDKFYPLWIGIDPMGIDVGQGPFFMGFGINANYFINNTFRLNASAFRPYARAVDSEIDTYSQTIKEDGIKLRLYHQFAISGTYYFKKKKSQRKASILLTQRASADYNSMENLVFKTKANNEWRWGVRAGYHYYQQTAGQQAFRLRDDSLDNGNLEIIHGFSVHSFTAGISYTSVQHMEASTKEYGHSIWSKTRLYYADIMFGIGGAVDVYQRDENGNRFNSESSKQYSMSNPGFRVGYERIIIRPKQKKLGGHIGVEYSSRPVRAFNTFEDAIVPRGFFSVRFGLYWAKKTL